MEVGKKFIVSTYFENIKDTTDQAKGIPQPPLTLERDIKKLFINLPDPKQISLPSLELRKAIEDRRSCRIFDGTLSLSMEDLSWLLWATQGIVKISYVKNSMRTYRNVPSAGARHPFESWIVIRKVNTLAPGVYRYLPIEHGLQVENITRDFSGSLIELCKKQLWMANASVFFIWIADVYRSVWRYGERAYRGIFQDSGHICQNLYLAAMNIGCGVCGIGDFEDLQISEFLELDENKFFPIYIGAVGRPLENKM
ncbi:MAG: SagB/ThcOx family dehydrogenase [Synergistaceae bacterium]|nr:SagB/ThcOx family dehydrogenase [Synergistaceae bacterium]